ncbi:MAG: ferrous iron transport protein A [Oscillospiraceae bacterium]|nr:ferrous iron transport protein A [Oscillospiraceae bacterium]
MPITYAGIGKECVIKKIGGNPQTKRFLEGLGFVEGSRVTVVNDVGGNVIVNVKESRVAVSKELAVKIMI